MSSTLYCRSASIKVCGETLYVDEDFKIKETGVRVFMAMHKRFASRAKAAYPGRTRNVLDLGRYVVKIPKNGLGIADNDWEGSVSNTEESFNDQRWTQYPKTRLCYVYGDLPIVFMEKIVPLEWSRLDRGARASIPDWVNSIDGGQVGYNRHGRLVAFDYGIR